MVSRPSTVDRILLPGVMLIAAIVHLSALGNHLVGDSWVFVHPRTFGETLAYFHTSIIPPEGQAFWFRPLPMFLFWLENLFHPGTEWLPHLTNILLHVLNVFLLWKLVAFMTAPGGKSVTASVTAAFTACLFLAIHPLTVGSVDWVAARFDVVCLTFGLAGLLAWLRWDSGAAGKRSLWLGAALLTGALLSKEQGVVFFLTAFSLTLIRAFRGKRGGAWTGLAIPIAVGFVYFIYRLALFGGVGGYVTARNGLSLAVPFNFFAAVLFPWPNVVENWTLSGSFWATALLLTALAGKLWIRPSLVRGILRWEYALAASLLLFLSLLTTMPNVGMTLQAVIGHAESRFALIPVAAFAMLLGLAASRLKSTPALRAALAVLILWGVAAAWRTTVQIQAWRGAGNIAHAIVAETMQLVPNPPSGSSLILLDIPRNTGQYAYIFGIGLDYALRRAYGREDIRFVRFPSRDDLRRADPDRDAVVQFSNRTGRMERLRAVRSPRAEVPEDNPSAVQ